MRKQLMLQGLSKLLVGALIMGALLFTSAGTLAWLGGWLLMGVLFLPMLVLGTVLLVRAPALLAKRLNAKEKEATQKGVLLASLLLFVAGFVLAGLDYRFHLLQLPFPVQLIGAVLFLLAYGLYMEVMRENAYLSRTVEVQEGQTVVDTGLYGIVRHPMYLAASLLFLSMPLVLGSVIAILPFLGFPITLVVRIRNEEKVLAEGLAGYTDYQKQVRYRLIPFIW